MKESWTDTMKHRLEGHKMAPPTGLWKGINEEMGFSPEHVSTKKPAAIRRWYWAAAAVILALVGFFALYDKDNHDISEPLSNTVSTQQPSEQTISSVPPYESSQPVEQEPQAERFVSAQVTHHKVVNNTIQEKTDTTEKMADDQTIVALSDSVPGVQQNVDDNQQSNQPSIISNHSMPQYEYVSKRNGSSSLGKWSVSLNASGGLLAANTIHPYISNAYYSFDVNTCLNVGQPHQHLFAWKHHPPVRFGLSLQYQLNQRLALVSGINYTFLSSEVSANFQNIYRKIYMQYIGVPFGLSWQLWSNRQFHIYLSGSTMVEKCFRSDFSNKKPWQFSINTAAGAEYIVTPQVGVYLEPSLGYYFDDGTSLEHYYKEHPFAPSIEFGVRLHLER